MVRTLTDEEQFCLSDCGTYKQYYVMRQRFENGMCAFCTIDAALNPILCANEHWTLWENAFKNDRPCEVMLVIATRGHFRSLGQITREGWAAFADIIEFVEANYDIAKDGIGGMLFMRFGDMRMNAGTVPHLHFNLWVPDKSKELRVPIFKDPTGRGRNESLAADFAARYERHEVPEM